MQVYSEYKERVIVICLTEKEAKQIRDLLGATNKCDSPDSPEMYRLLDKELAK